MEIKINLSVLIGILLGVIIVLLTNTVINTYVNASRLDSIEIGQKKATEEISSIKEILTDPNKTTFQ